MSDYMTPEDLEERASDPYRIPQRLRTNHPIHLLITNPSTEERRDDRLWRQLREKFPGKNFNHMDPNVLIRAARELGYEDYARAWEGSGPGK